MESTSYKSAPKYRQVGFGSSIDESLFGSTDGTKRRTITGPINPSAAVISVDELLRIKNSSIIKTESDILREREIAQKTKEEREKLSKERKDKMRELEKKAVLLAKKSDSELAAEAKKQTLRNLAEKQIDNNSDVVKLLNSMAMRATAFTIRDQQLEEKKRLEEIEHEHEKRADMEIELDRLKDIVRREDEEKYKRVKRVEDRKVINEQIATRQKLKLLSLEAREQENIAMRNTMNKYKEEDEINAARRKVEIERSREEVFKANEEAIRRKKEIKDNEKREMEQILLYQAMKDAELAKREEEEAAIEHMKKERQAKLLAQQEKVQNNQGKQDELRARRAAEEKERNEREKEKAEAIKRRKEMKELLESRAAQAQSKLALKELEKQQVEEEIRQQLLFIQRQDQRENAEKEAKVHKNDEHKKNLQTQIEERERMRSRNRAGDNEFSVREELLREEAKLQVIRDKMVADLAAQGVNPKYLSEMKNVDIGKILKR